jgi:hypothetical protein
MIWTPSFYGRQKRSFQLQYDDENAPAADAGSTTGVSARTGTTGPRSYISNVSMRVFGSTGEPGGRRESGTEDS